MKARSGSLARWAMGRLDGMAAELRKERPDLDSKEAFAAIVLNGMTSYAKSNPVKLLWRWKDSPESDLSVNAAFHRHP